MAVNAHKLGPGTLTFGESSTMKDFQTKVTNARLTPSVDQEDPIPVLSGDEYLEDIEVTSVMAGTFLQDYGSEALVKWCWDHSGETMPFEFQPRSDQGLVISGECQIRPVEIGGDVKTTNTTDFEFPLIGQPDLGDAGTGGDGGGGES